MARTSKQHLIEGNEFSDWLNRNFSACRKTKQANGAKQGVRERRMQCYILESPGRAPCGGRVQLDFSKQEV